MAAITAYGAYQVILLATPYALMHVAMNKIDGRLEVNSLGFPPMATADNQPIVRPSPDLAYSGCVFDVSKGPVLLDIAPVPDHYWSVSVFDARTDVRPCAVTATPAESLPGWRCSNPVSRHPRDRARHIQHDHGIALVRVLLGSPDEYPQ